jgi:hypothetical protein
MSRTMSAVVRFEDHIGPIGPDVTAPSAPVGADETTPSNRLRELADDMRRCVVGATTATDLATKVGLWESYRTARAEALAMVVTVPEAPDPPRLRTV